MSESQARPESWSDYWAKEGAGGEVFVGKDGRTHPQLAEFWRGQFAPLAPSAKVVDLACGAGSVLAHLDEPGRFELHGLDVSAEALALLNERLPMVRTEVGSVAEPPYKLASFDLVASQFGIEYAGVHAFDPAAELVAQGGRLVALVHYRDGHIDRKNRRLLAGAKAATEAEFADCALDLVKAGLVGDKAQQDAAADAFIPAERRLAQVVETNREGVHAQLYLGFRHLFKERQHYQAQDILVWIARAKEELQTALSRLSAMCDAALSGEQMELVRSNIAAAGLDDIELAPFMTTNNELPIAWQLTARR